MTKVKVCDAIMGTGKSSAAITYMNEYPEKKFIYITPYLDEAKRISDNCKRVKFYEPQQKTEFEGSKILHTIDLVRNGKNVATTHQAFLNYPRELLESIREQKYILIIDENIDTLKEVDESLGDIQALIRAGYIEEAESGIYRVVDDSYSGKKFKTLFTLMKTREIVKAEAMDTFNYWLLPKELIESFETVYILTYMFYGQGLCRFLEINHIPYDYIGIQKAEGRYRFSETSHYIPEYVSTLKEKIHIIDHEKLNQVGEKQTALSKSWFENCEDGVMTLKNNVGNLYKHLCKVPRDERMWTTFKDAKNDLKGLGYTKGFVPFNQKSKNEFRDKTVLAYCVNIYLPVGQKIYYLANGLDPHEDDYALSTMVQWVWRSAIRDGKEIWLYIPSKRMRTLFIKWLDDVSGANNS